MYTKYYLETGYILTDGKHATGCLSAEEVIIWCHANHYEIIKENTKYGLHWVVLKKKKEKKGKSHGQF